MSALAALLVVGLLIPATAAADPTPAQAVANLNTWRMRSQSLVSTTRVSAWTTGCAHHNNYEFVNGKTLTHTDVGQSWVHDRWSRRWSEQRDRRFVFVPQRDAGRVATARPDVGRRGLPPGRPA